MVFGPGRAASSSKFARCDAVGSSLLDESYGNCLKQNDYKLAPHP